MLCTCSVGLRLFEHSKFGRDCFGIGISADFCYYNGAMELIIVESNVLCVLLYVEITCYHEAQFLWTNYNNNNY